MLEGCSTRHQEGVNVGIWNGCVLLLFGFITGCEGMDVSSMWASKDVGVEEKVYLGSQILFRKTSEPACPLGRSARFEVAAVRLSDS